MLNIAKLISGKAKYLAKREICTVQSEQVLKIFQTIIIISASLIISPAYADILIGAKIGKMIVDVPSNKNPTNIAATFGYEIDTRLADLSVVGEVNRTMHSGETSQGEDLKFSSEGVYLVWKTTRSLFVTLRGGVVQNEIFEGEVSNKSDGILFGGSVGFVVGRTRMQVEYTTYAGDANFLGFGIEF